MIKKAGTARLLLKGARRKTSVARLFTCFKKLGLSIVRGRFSSEDSTFIVDVIGPRNRLHEAVKACLKDGFTGQPFKHAH